MTNTADAIAVEFRSPDASHALLLRRIREQPDPSIELRTPFWLVGGDRGAAQQDVLTRGGLALLKGVRRALDHPNLEPQLKPFLLLSPPEGTRGLLGLARWLEERCIAPSTRDWIGFIERQARKVWPEWKTHA